MQKHATLAYPDACDCHIHIFEDAYPLAPTAKSAPPPAPAARYQEVQATLGLSRAVVVQPTGYGFDNRCTLGAIEQLGANARGIAVIRQDVADAELQRLHRAGIRGVRYMMLPGGLLPWESLETLAAHVAPLGWNINLQLDGRELPYREAMLGKLPGRLVIDHIGKFLGPVTVQDEAFLSLRRLLEQGRCWIKLSAPYESARKGPPGYEDAAGLARTLARDYPERCLWASNWPHLNINPCPGDKDLLDWALHCLETEAVKRKVLVDNPAEVYGFPAA